MEKYLEKQKEEELDDYHVPNFGENKTNKKNNYEQRIQEKINESLHLESKSKEKVNIIKTKQNEPIEIDFDSDFDQGIL